MNSRGAALQGAALFVSAAMSRGSLRSQGGVERRLRACPQACGEASLSAVLRMGPLSLASCCARHSAHPYAQIGRIHTWPISFSSMAHGAASRPGRGAAAAGGGGAQRAGGDTAGAGIAAGGTASGDHPDRPYRCGVRADRGGGVRTVHPRGPFLWRDGDYRRGRRGWGNWRIDAICYVDAFWPQDGESLWDITSEFEHNWYIDSQKHKPGYVDPIGGVDFAVVPGVVGYHPLLTLLEAVRLSGGSGDCAQGLYLRDRLAADAVRALCRGGEGGGAGSMHETGTDHFDVMPIDAGVGPARVAVWGWRAKGTRRGEVELVFSCHPD